MKNALAVIGLLTLSGCIGGGNWVRQTVEPKGGTIEYSDDGAVFVVESRREDAIKKIEQYCAPGGYKIMAQDYGSQVVGQTVSQGAFGMVNVNNISSNSVYLHFVCN